MFKIFNMQDPNEDTEWNDILRAKGIIPEKPKEKEITEDDIVNMVENTIQKKTEGRPMNVCQAETMTFVLKLWNRLRFNA